MRSGRRPEKSGLFQESAIAGSAQQYGVKIRKLPGNRYGLLRAGHTNATIDAAVKPVSAWAATGSGAAAAPGRSMR
jgi:hypothetical protein